MNPLSSELLGFGADDRVLIVNCDDFGMHESINHAVVDAIENGIASSCSLLVPCPAAAHAMELLLDRPHIPFGVHLALVRDIPGYHWAPVADRSEVASLLDPGTGELYLDTEAGLASFLAAATTADVEREMRAQIDAVIDKGLAPTHLDWHCMANGGRGDIFDVTMKLAEEYGLALRVSLADDQCEVERPRGPFLDHPVLDTYAVDLDDKPATFERMLVDLPPGLTEWATHPGLGTEDWRTIETTTWRVRQTDHAFLVSQRAQEILDREGIAVSDYRPLQSVWNSGSAGRR